MHPNKFKALRKAYDVYDSCETLAQVRVAVSYGRLVLRQFLQDRAELDRNTLNHVTALLTGWQQGATYRVAKAEIDSRMKSMPLGGRRTPA